MTDRTFLTWPFFTDRHRALADAIERWCAAKLPVDHDDVDAACRKLVAQLGRDGWLMHTAPDPLIPAPLDVRTLCLMRETLARYDGLADFAFAMQGLGAGAIIAMASDIRLATPEAKTAFLFTRVGLAGCDMGACALLPRIIGQGRASELLYTGRDRPMAVVEEGPCLEARVRHQSPSKIGRSLATKAR